MKKSIKVFLTVMCVALVGVVFLVACSFGAPKVKGCTYEYDKIECDTSNLGLSSTEQSTINAEVTSVGNKAAKKLVFSADDDQVEYYTSATAYTMHTYEQSGVNVLIYDAPNQNTNYGGDLVTGYTVTKDSNEVLVWHQAKTFTTPGGETKQVDIYIYYNLVTAAE